MKPAFKAKGYDIPSIRVTCGWPSSGGLASKKRTLGEAWTPKASADKTGEIFISPYLDSPTDTMGVLATLVHEVIHEAVGLECGHKGPFKKCAKAMGLEGKMTSTNAGPELMEFIAEWANALGPYPHAKLDRTKSPKKKQSTRMIKCECGECGYVVRTTRKWIDDIGAPHCPKHGEMNVEESGGGDEE
jgi:hypothetical protein